MSEPRSASKRVEVFGLTVLELRKLESEVSKGGVVPTTSPATEAFREPGFVALALTLTPVVVTALIAILIVPRSGKKKEVRMVQEDSNGVRTEVVVKESDYSSGTLSPEALKALSDFFKMDVRKVITEILSGKE